VAGDSDGVKLDETLAISYALKNAKHFAV